jgi:hypothetical protein
MDPRTVRKALHDCVRNYDAEFQASLFAEDGAWKLSFAPAGVPRRLEGKDQIVAVSKAGMERSRPSSRTITRRSERL